MCGRYTIWSINGIAEALGSLQLSLGESADNFRASYNAAPTQQLPVIIGEGDHATVVPMTWTLRPYWLKPGEKPKFPLPFNARSESVTEKKMFSGAIKRTRCIVPANGFYEWREYAPKKKQPYFIHPNGSDFFLFAGLYNETKNEDGQSTGSFAILTTSANDKMSYLHDRMPVMLESEDAEIWLDPDMTETGPLETFMQSAPDDAIDFHPVSKAVGSSRNQGPELIEPIDDPDE